MKISILHPTRSRKQQALITAHKWMRNSDRPHNIEYIFSVDNSDTEEWTDVYKFTPQFFYNSSFVSRVVRNDNRSAIDAVNNAAKVCTGDLIIQIADDFDCNKHWDTLLINALKGKEDFCVKTIDNIQPTLMTLPIMDKVYYERFGYIYHPSYSHLWSDNELTAVAHMLGRDIYLPIVFEHLHPITGKTKADELNHRNNQTMRSGQILFEQRRRDNFGLSPEQIVKPYSEIRWH